MKAWRWMWYTLMSGGTWNPNLKWSFFAFFPKYVRCRSVSTDVPKARIRSSCTGSLTWRADQMCYFVQTSTWATALALSMSWKAKNSQFYAITSEPLPCLPSRISQNSQNSLWVIVRYGQVYYCRCRDIQYSANNKTSPSKNEDQPSAISLRAKQMTPLSWPLSVWTNSPFSTSHSLMVMSVLQVMRQAESQENWQSHTHFRCPFSVLCSDISNLPLSMFTLNSLIFLSAEQVARNLLLGESCILRMQSSCALMIFWLVFDMCSPQQLMSPSLSPIAIRSNVSLTVIDLMLQSTSIFIISLPLLRSHHLTMPSSSPVRMEPSVGWRAVQLMGLSCLKERKQLRTRMSKRRRQPSSHPVQITCSCFQKHPTEVTFPLKSLSQERRCWSGRLRSYTFAQLFMPMTILLLSSVIQMRLGAEESLMVSAGLLEPVEGSQNLIVLSYDPLASFNAIDI